MEKLLNEILGWPGHIVSGSKTFYREKNPTHLVIFNANVCTDAGKVWWGDVDVTISKNDLSQLAKESGKTIYVLYEIDGRFENEKDPKLDQAAIKFMPDGSFEINESLKKYYSLSA